MTSLLNVGLIVLCSLLTFLQKSEQRIPTSRQLTNNASSLNFSVRDTTDLNENETDQNCEIKNVVLRTQSDVDNFGNEHSSCAVISALDIRGEEIYNLKGLSGIKEIKSYISIRSTSLTNLSALSGAVMDSIDYLIVNSNPNLKSLHGIKCSENLKHLTIRNNKSLKDLDYLSRLEQTDYLYLSQNDSLISILGLRNLSHASRVGIYLNGRLQNVNGLEKLKSVTTLSLFENHNLFNIDALYNLKEYSMMYIGNNCSLAECCGVMNAMQNHTKDNFLIISNNSVTCRDNEDMIKGCLDN